jgi:hypothetical protein
VVRVVDGKDENSIETAALRDRRLVGCRDVDEDLCGADALTLLKGRNESHCLVRRNDADRGTLVEEVCGLVLESGVQFEEIDGRTRAAQADGSCGVLSRDDDKLRKGVVGRGQDVKLGTGEVDVVVQLHGEHAVPVIDDGPSFRDVRSGDVMRWAVPFPSSA